MKNMFKSYGHNMTDPKFATLRNHETHDVKGLSSTVIKLVHKVFAKDFHIRQCRFPILGGLDLLGRPF